MSKNMSRLSEVPEILSISRATLYNYLNRFKEILETHTILLDNVKYIDSSGLELLREILSRKASGQLSLDEIKSELLNRLRIGEIKEKIQDSEQEDIPIRHLDSDLDRTAELEAENARLKIELTATKGMVDKLENDKLYLQEELSETRKRQDTIILQLTRQLEGQQKLLEYKESPWYTRWFRKKKPEID